VFRPGSNPFLSVPIRSYPFTLEPLFSVGIRRVARVKRPYRVIEWYERIICSPIIGHAYVCSTV
jgi:hypothetical protein